MTIKAQKNLDLQYYAPSGSISLSYTTKKDCSALLICSNCAPGNLPFSYINRNCKVNGVEQNCNILGSSITWFSTAITFIEHLAADSVIDLYISGTCDTTSYGQLALAVITNE